ncbi:MAG: glycosyltransferase family 4 protein [Caldilineales bacterium]|nr:glycosyltransferase family 4 protein [Caldilineales bacterium]
MRLLLDARTLRDDFPGIGRYVYNLANALAPILDGELILLAGDDSRNTQYDLSALARHPNFTLVPADTPIFSWRVQTDLPRLIRSLKPDLVHFPYNVRPFRLDLPSVLTLYDVIPRLYPDYFSRRRRWQIEFIQRFALRASNRFVAISQATANDFHSHYSVNTALITTTPLAPDPIFQPQPPEVIASLRARLELPDCYVLYLGSNKPHKNLERLVQAWGLVQRSGVGDQRSEHASLNLQSPIPNPQLLIAGAWDERYPEPKRLAEQLSLGESVRFLGPIANADLPALYAGAALFIFPSVYEGFGLPVLEAMACGTPVACSNTSSLPEVAGDAAILFDPYDVEAIAEAMVAGLGDADLWEQLNRQGLAQAAKFTWEQTARATLAAYHRLLN